MVQDGVVFGLHWESKKGGWASLEMRLREFFLGKKASRPGKEVVVDLKNLLAIKILKFGKF